MIETQMQTRTLRCVAVLGVVVALFGTRSAAQGTDPVVGTWVLNVAKSTFSPGPAPKSESRTYVATGKETKVTSAGVGADGKPTAGEWTIVADGRDVPMTGNPNADTLSLKQIDAFNTEFALKKAGKVVITGTRTISRDGKVMTITNKGINAKGQARCTRHVPAALQSLYPAGWRRSVLPHRGSVAAGPRDGISQTDSERSPV